MLLSESKCENVCQYVFNNKIGVRDMLATIAKIQLALILISKVAHLWIPACQSYIIIKLEICDTAAGSAAFDRPTGATVRCLPAAPAPVRGKRTWSPLSTWLSAGAGTRGHPWILVVRRLF